MIKVAFTYEKGPEAICENVTKIVFPNGLGAQDSAEKEELLTKPIPIVRGENDTIFVYTTEGMTSIASSGLRAIKRSKDD